MLNILNNTTLFNFLHLPTSITIGISIPLLTLFSFTLIFSSGFVGTRCHFSSWLAAHEFILTLIFPHYFLEGLIVPYFPTPPPATLLLDALPFHIVFWDIHCLSVSSPYYDCFLLELAYEFLLHHASKCILYPVPSLCIHLLHTANTIILPVHYSTSNLGSWIFPRCGECTCPSYHVSCPHILVNLSLSCFPKSVLFQNKLWHIFAATSP